MGASRWRGGWARLRRGGTGAHGRGSARGAAEHRGVAAASAAATSRRVGRRDNERGGVAAASAVAGSAAAGASRWRGGWARPRRGPRRSRASRRRGGEHRGDVATSGASRRNAAVNTQMPSADEKCPADRRATVTGRWFGGCAGSEVCCAPNDEPATVLYAPRAAWFVNRTIRAFAATQRRTP